MLVALGVSGGIAAYKAAEIVRGLTKAGAEVQVLMTENAGRFVTALTLQTLSGRKVFSDAWEAEGDVVVRHIDLARRIDALVVAPATANVIANNDCIGKRLGQISKVHQLDMIHPGVETQSKLPQTSKSFSKCCIQ